VPNDILQTMRIILLALWVVALGLPALASAQEDDDTRARRHFASGESYFEEGAYEDAVREFAQAYRLSHRPALLFNLYTAEERFGRLSDAATHLEQYLQEMPPDLENRVMLEARLVNLRARIAAEAAPDPDPQTTRPDVQPSPTASNGSGDLMLGGGIALGIGGAGFVTFAVAGVMALGERDRLRDDCMVEPCDASSLSELNLRNTVADIGLGLGIAGATAGIIMLAVGATSGPSEQQVAVTPVVSSTYAGVLAGGQF
jgi:hypothetical protein